MAARFRFNPWLLAPLAALIAAGLTFWQRSQVPARADWRAAVAHVKAHLQPGDGLTWLPWHAGEGRLFFHGLPAFHLPEPERADLSRYKRVWLLGAFGADAGDLVHRPLADTGPLASTPSSAHQVAERHTFGPLTLELLTISGPPVVGDLRADLKSMQVSQVKGDQATLCDFWGREGWHCRPKRNPQQTQRCLDRPSGKRRSNTCARQFRGWAGGYHLAACDLEDCGLDPFVHVSRDAQVIGDEARRCVWMHPRKGQTVRLIWPEAPAGQALVIDHGFVDKVVHDNYARFRVVKPITLKVSRGETLLTSTPVPAEKGWRRLTVPLEGGAAPLIIEVEAPAGDKNAFFCLDATVRGAG